MKSKLEANIAADLSGEGPGFVIETVRIIRRFDRYSFAKAGRTIGQAIDGQIEQTILDDEELQDIAIHFEQADWAAMRDTFFANRNRS